MSDKSKTELPEEEEASPELLRKLMIRQIAVFIGNYQIALLKLHQKPIDEFYIPISAFTAMDFAGSLKFSPHAEDVMKELNEVLHQFELRASYGASVMYRTVVEVYMHGHWMRLPIDEASNISSASLLIKRIPVKS